MASPSTRLAPVLVVACALSAVHEVSGQSSTAQPPTPQRIASGFGEGAYRPQRGITDPEALFRPVPRYTAEARRANIEGEVEIEAVVEADGNVAATRIVKSLDQTYGLDEEALRTAQRWRFRPATYNNKPVPIVVRVILEFRLSGQPPPPATSLWITDAEFLKGVARMGQSNVTMPVLEQSVEPKYTAEAMRAKLSGTVTVDLVVGADGRVLRSRIVRSLDPSLGLDRNAIAAANQWRFKPGLVNGQPAPVLVTVTMEFKLH